MKSKILKMMGVLLVLSLMLMAIPAPLAANGAPPDLTISVTPADGTSVFCGGDPATLTATVSNAPGAACAEDVVISAEVLGTAPNATLAPTTDTLLYDICAGWSKQASWTLTFTAPGPVTVQFTATATYGCTPYTEVTTVTYNQLCRLGVEITLPLDGAHFNVSDTFAVTALVTNNTTEDCTDATVTLSKTGNADIVGGTGALTGINIRAGDTQELNWTVHCTDNGDVDLTVTATGCGQTGACATACADTITIQQGVCTPQCAFDIEILPPDYICDEDICVGSPFDVLARVTNNGDECGGSISGTVEMRATGDAHEPGQLNTDNSIQETFTSIAPGESQVLTFTWECYDADDCVPQSTPTPGPDAYDLYQNGVDFEARGWGSCAGGLLLLPTEPPDQDWDSYHASDTYDDYINQTWIDLTFVDSLGNPVCTCQDFCALDDILMYPRVHNCGTSTLLNVSVDFLSVFGNITLTGGAANITIGDIPAGATVTSAQAFHFECTAPGEVYLYFKAMGVYAPTTTVCDYEGINLHQKAPGDFSVVIDAPDCQQYCDTFDVTATVTHTGVGVVSNVLPVMGTTGAVSLVSGPVLTSGDTNTNGTLDVGEAWLYTWTYHCTGAADASFTATVTGSTVCSFPDLLTHTSATDYTEQVMLDINIISPTACSTYWVCDTFCVTAEISDNDADTCFSGLEAVITFPNGKAELVTGETANKAFALTQGDTQQISWTVHCMGAGDADIKVEVLGAAGQSGVAAPCNECTLFDKIDTITVHQITPPALELEILSPANYMTYIATSQDFAVTATLTNTGQADFIGLPVSIAAVPTTAASTVAPTQVVDIPGESSINVTWTMHCDGQGLTEIIVDAAGLEDSVSILQYPAAHLEVEIIQVLPATTINVCDNFTIYYKVKNTGEADATEVEAILSVTPEGSARPVEGIGSGYTQFIGTIPAGGETAVLTWPLHCKVACESNIVITAEGNDEYGWHKKQECQSTGVYTMDEGVGSSVFKMAWCDSGSGYEEGAFLFQDGEANGLIGPFNLEAECTFAWAGVTPTYLATCCSGMITIVGVTYPDGTMEGIYFLKDMMPCDPDGTYDCVGYGIITVDDVLFNVVNGLFEGDFHGTYMGGDITVAITNGLYCSIMASTPGMAIITDFIEPATVTVKQLPSMADLEVIKTVNVSAPVVIGTEVTFTVTVKNLGPSDATSIWVWDMLPAGLNYVSSSPDQGYYYVSSGFWSVGDLEEDVTATLTITAAVNTVGTIENLAAVDFADQHDPTTGNNADTATVTGLAASLHDEWTIHLDAGYNLISLPLIPTDPDDNIADMMSGLDFIKVSQYVNDGDPTPDDWYNYNPPPAPSDLDEMTDGWGYWVNMATPGDLYFTGYEIAPPPPALPHSYDVLERWNLIGFRSTTPKLAAEYLAGIAGQYTMIYGFDNGIYFVVGSAGHEFLQPELGYWLAVKIGEFGTIFP